MGVNKHKLATEDPVQILEVDNVKVREAQIERLKHIKATRDDAAVKAALAALTEAAARARATCSPSPSMPCACAPQWRNPTRWRPSSAATVPTRGHRRVRSRLRLREGWAQLQDEIRAFGEAYGRRPRVMIAKLGQDGHDRGAKVVATAFADLGFDVDIGPLFQTPEGPPARPSRTTSTPSASPPAAGHKTLVPAIIAELKRQGADDIIVFVGGVIPQQDYDFLYAAGVPAKGASMGPARPSRPAPRACWRRSRRRVAK